MPTYIVVRPIESVKSGALQSYEVAKEDSPTGWIARKRKRGYKPDRWMRYLNSGGTELTIAPKKTGHVFLGAMISHPSVWLIATFSGPPEQDLGLICDMNRTCTASHRRDRVLWQKLHCRAWALVLQCMAPLLTDSMGRTTINSVQRFNGLEQLYRFASSEHAVSMSVRNVPLGAPIKYDQAQGTKNSQHVLEALAGPTYSSCTRAPNFCQEFTPGLPVYYHCSTYPQYNWQPRQLGAEPRCVELLLAMAGNCLWDCVEPFKNFDT
ncbi:hypothetical protein B0H19DRAFT_1078006 [Mycena capillaripes]|nr:hypothetical protein B0H19DRAFT_1078006 [Mycena capillaripes]